MFGIEPGSAERMVAITLRFTRTELRLKWIPNKARTAAKWLLSGVVIAASRCKTRASPPQWILELVVLADAR